MPATDGVYDFWFVDYDSNVISQTFTYNVGEGGPVTPRSISLSPETLSLTIGDTAELTVTVEPADAETSLIWTSVAPDVASVNEAGVVTAHQSGQTDIIVVTDNGLSASCQVTVSALVTSIELNPASIEGHLYDTFSIEATVSPDNATDPRLEWSSSNPEIATVTDYGFVNLLAVGDAMITVTALDGSGVTATCNVTVLPILPEYVDVYPSSAEGVRGETLQLTANVYPENTTDKTVTWSSDSPEVAVVDANGLVEMLTPGEAVVTATVGDVVGECRITVNPVFVEQILLTPEFVEAVEGTEITLVAEVIPIDADNTTLEWSSDNEAVATVSQEGVVNILAPGEAIVTAAATDGSLVKGQSVVTGISGVGLISGDGCEWKLYDLSLIHI